MDKTIRNSKPKPLKKNLPPHHLLPSTRFYVSYLYPACNNSQKTTGARTIRGFSIDAQEKLSGEKWFNIYSAYWGAPDYADQFTSDACNGTGDFEDAPAELRAEGCIKGAQ